VKQDGHLTNQYKAASSARRSRPAFQQSLAVDLAHAALALQVLAVHWALAVAVASRVLVPEEVRKLAVRAFVRCSVAPIAKEINDEMSGMQTLP